MDIAATTLIEDLLEIWTQSFNNGEYFWPVLLCPKKMVLVFLII